MQLPRVPIFRILTARRICALGNLQERWMLSKVMKGREYSRINCRCASDRVYRDRRWFMRTSPPGVIKPQRFLSFRSPLAPRYTARHSDPKAQFVLAQTKA